MPELWLTVSAQSWIYLEIFIYTAIFMVVFITRKIAQGFSEVLDV